MLESHSSPLNLCVSTWALGKVRSLPAPQFLHQQNGNDDNSTSVKGLVRRLNVLIFVKCLGQCQAQPVI